MILSRLLRIFVFFSAMRSCPATVQPLQGQVAVAGGGTELQRWLDIGQQLLQPAPANPVRLPTPIVIILSEQVECDEVHVHASLDSAARRGCQGTEIELPTKQRDQFPIQDQIPPPSGCSDDLGRPCRKVVVTTGLHEPSLRPDRRSPTVHLCTRNGCSGLPTLADQPAAGLGLSALFFVGSAGFMFVYAVALQMGLRLGPLGSGLAIIPVARAFGEVAVEQPVVSCCGQRVVTTGAALPAVGAGHHGGDYAGRRGGQAGRPFLHPAGPAYLAPGSLAVVTTVQVLVVLTIVGRRVQAV
jgi:hypothetical protein